MLCILLLQCNPNNFILFSACVLIEHLDENQFGAEKNVFYKVRQFFFRNARLILIKIGSNLTFHYRTNPTVPHHQSHHLMASGLLYCS